MIGWNEQECTFCGEPFKIKALSPDLHPVRRGSPRTFFGWKKAGLPAPAFMCFDCRRDFREAGFEIAEFSEYVRAWQERHSVRGTRPLLAEATADAGGESPDESVVVDPQPDTTNASQVVPVVPAIADELAKLFALHEAGALTRQEFEQHKARILGNTPDRPQLAADAPRTPHQAGDANPGPSSLGAESLSGGTTPGRPEGPKGGCLGCLGLMAAGIVVSITLQMCGPYKALDVGDECATAVLTKDNRWEKEDPDPMFVCKDGLRCVYNRNRGWRTGGMIKYWTCQ